VNVLPWVVYPYLVLAVFVGGHVWRWRTGDLRSWTTKSSQLLERRWLRIGSPLFHIGLLGVLGGHVFGLLVPARLTSKVGISDHLYHLSAVAIGGFFGIICLAGITILTARRLFVPAVRRAGNVNNIIVDLLLLTVIALGDALTLGYQLFVHEYDYRETISVWVRQIPLGHPDPAIMSHVPWIYQAHILAALTLLAFWPFSRLVHAWTAPLHYLFRRSHILYRAPVQMPPVETELPVEVVTSAALVVEKKVSWRAVRR
jgi:nitrate reductase gamma subunit